MSQPQLMLEYRKPLELTWKPTKPKHQRSSWHKRKYNANSKIARLEAEVVELEKRALAYQHLVNAWIKTRRVLVENKFDDWKGSKSTLFATYQDWYKNEGAWSVATENRLENFADKICEETGLSLMRDIMLKIVQHLYKQELVRYVEELHKFQAKTKELNIEFEKRFEVWKAMQLENERNTMIENLRKDQKVLRNWVGDFRDKNQNITVGTGKRP